MKFTKVIKTVMSLFDLNKTIPYFKKPTDYTPSKYKIITDIFSDKYKYLSKEKQKIYSPFLWLIMGQPILVEKIIKNYLEKSGKYDLGRVGNYFTSNMGSDIEIKHISKCN